MNRPTDTATDTAAKPAPVAPLQHLAIIMDGNGRWAQRRGRPRSFGHRAGRDAMKATVTRAAELGIPYLTLFAFSSENWNRPATEVRLLMDLLKRALVGQVSELDENDIRIRFIGDRSAFHPDIQELMASAEATTADNRRMLLNIALNYGGRWDIAQAAQKLAIEMAGQPGPAGQPAEDPEAALARHLSLADCPQPDLLIRTGGEQRVSNFLLWDLAYSELWFSDILWPDFGPEALDQAITDFRGRERRFGHTSDQLDHVRSA